MILLIVAAVIFLGLHVAAFGTLCPWRAQLLEKYGKRNYHIGFSVASTLSLLFFFHAYKVAPYINTWGQLGWFKPIAALLMIPAFVLIAGGVRCPKHDGCAGGEGEACAPEVKGVLRITRHPVVWGLALWALLHLIANGDVASLILFGSLYGLCIAGSFSLDKKQQAAMGDAWQAFAEATSNRPFQALREKRTNLGDWRVFLLEEIGWKRLAAAAGAYVLLAWLHVKLLGVSPFI